MDIGIAQRSVYALLVIGVLLFGLWYAARLANRTRIVGSPGKRLVTMLETTFLSQHATLHVVKAGSRHLLIGSGNTGPVLITELPDSDVDQWLDEQRRMLAAPAATLGEIFQRLRGK